MFKFGIYTLQELRTGNDQSIFGREKNVSITLLQELCSDEWPDHLYDRIMYGMIDDRGAYKRTYRNRFEDFDNIAAAILEKNFGNCSSTFLFHDTAVSNASTAVDFYHQLSTYFPNMQYFASDYDPYLTVLTRGRLAVVLASTGQVIEIKWQPFVFMPTKPESRVFYAGNHLIRWVIQRWFVRPLLHEYISGCLSQSAIGKLTLFAPAALATEKESDNFHLLKHNLLSASPLTEKLHCIRAMNVLNPGYFKERELQSLLTHIWEALDDHGILITGSNQDRGTEMSGGIYRKSERGFETLWLSRNPPHAHLILKSMS